MSTRYIAIIAALLMWGSAAHAQTAVQITGGGKTATVKTGTTALTSDNALIVVDPGVLAAVTGAIPTGANIIGFTSNDPCTNGTKTNVAIATATGTTQLVAPSGSTQVYVCSFSLITAATAVVNLVGGTGATCTTGTPVAAIGSTTAASGMSLAANGGLTFGGGGGTVARTTTAGHGLCLIQSGTAAIAGNITYVQQ
jgi:hypothetical protein